MRMLELTQLSPSLFDRMNQDLAYDAEEGLKILNYQPRDFLPVFKK